MKTVLGNIHVTEEQKALILSHPYLMDSENRFKINFSDITAEFDPFEKTEEKDYTLHAELDAMGWISVGEIFAKTKTTV